MTKTLVVALRKESVDRNSPGTNTILFTTVSLSARRAWIEIEITLQTVLLVSVVALRKESVDRNRQFLQKSLLSYVALRKESVDRNVRIMIVSNGLKPSLSARRAWIEIVWVLQS